MRNKKQNIDYGLFHSYFCSIKFLTNTISHKVDPINSIFISIKITCIVDFHQSLMEESSDMPRVMGVGEIPSTSRDPDHRESCG